jgi:high-affinity K+ transport system ATPase subunit B
MSGVDLPNRQIIRKVRSALWRVTWRRVYTPRTCGRPPTGGMKGATPLAVAVNGAVLGVIAFGRSEARHPRPHQATARHEIRTIVVTGTIR